MEQLNEVGHLQHGPDVLHMCCGVPQVLGVLSLGYQLARASHQVRAFNVHAVLLVPDASAPAPPQAAA